jgi:transcriptional regulator with XRE-family HTH domain
VPRPAEVSRRLKAARWLAGGLDEKGKPKPLSVKELAALRPLPENGISANRLEEIEQMKITAPPMELEKIAQALELPDDWFTAEAPQVSRGLAALDQLQQALVDLGLAPGPSQEEAPSTEDGPDHQPGAAGSVA